MRKRFLMLLTTAMMLLTLSACGERKDLPPEPSQTSEISAEPSVIPAAPLEEDASPANTPVPSAAPAPAVTPMSDQSTVNDQDGSMTGELPEDILDDELIPSTSPTTADGTQAPPPEVNPAFDPNNGGAGTTDELELPMDEFP